MGSVSLSAGHRCVIVPFRSLRHVHRPTAFAGQGPFELYEHMWRTCLASAADRADITPPMQSLFVPLDVSHMSRIVTGAKSWNMMSYHRCVPCMTATAYGQSHINCALPGLNYRDCVSLLQGCLLPMRLNDARKQHIQSFVSVPASAVPDNWCPKVGCTTQRRRNSKKTTLGAAK